MGKVKDVIDVEVLISKEGRESWRPVAPKKGQSVGIAVCLLAMFGALLAGAFGLLEGQGVVGALAVAAIAGMALLARGRRVSQLYLVALAVGVVGLVLAAVLPGAWAVVGVPFCLLAGAMVKALERKGWVHA